MYSIFLCSSPLLPNLSIRSSSEKGGVGAGMKSAPGDAGERSWPRGQGWEVTGALGSRGEHWAKGREGGEGRRNTPHGLRPESRLQGFHHLVPHLYLLLIEFVQTLHLRQVQSGRSCWAPSPSPCAPTPGVRGHAGLRKGETREWLTKTDCQTMRRHRFWQGLHISHLKNGENYWPSLPPKLPWQISG